MNRTVPLVVINVVGLTPSLLNEQTTPHLYRLMTDGYMTPLKGVFPAVTTTAQATMLTGTPASQHGIVGNGWYFRDQAEVRFWLQPDQLIQGEKVWHRLKQANPGFCCSKLFWWYNMYAGVDNAITPRPHYPADGRKIMGLYSEPASLQATIEKQIGTFPFFHFWGPASGIRSSRWIVECAMAEFELNTPHLQMVYLPHLDYNLQRLGPDHPAIDQDLQAIDHEAGRLIDFARNQGAEVMVVSEYGITGVNRSVSLNRVLREAGLLRVRESLTWELLDPGASLAFAVADHQVAHIYIKQPSDMPLVKKRLEQVPGVEQVLDATAKAHFHINHPRSGELIAIAEPGCWFNYYYWLDGTKAPDFARTVDIHRKPGYDPAELFIDPGIPFPRFTMARKLLGKKLGLRTLMDVIPLDPTLVKGSHGRLAASPEESPLVISSTPLPDSLKPCIDEQGLPMTSVYDLMLAHFGIGEKKCSKRKAVREKQHS